MSDKKSNPKLANMHYPGMRADPNEVRGDTKWALPEQYRARFATHLEAFGENVLGALYEASVLVLGADPVAVHAAKNLADLGVGRVGMFGEQGDVLPALSKWFKSDAPWSVFEPFRGASIERQFEDVLRGFDYVQLAANVLPRDFYCKHCFDVNTAAEPVRLGVERQAALAAQSLTQIVQGRLSPLRCRHL